ncbi:MAG: membrane protein insertase YidC [Bacteroidales bacterium]|nr:membrane protein insertase YidC [Bacteroidales bacterium]
MDRNSILGIIIIAGILIVWGITNKPDENQLEEAKRKRDSLELVQQQQLEQELASQSQQRQADTITATEDVTNPEQLKNQLGEFAHAGAGEEDFYTLENDLLKLIISTKGGRPYSVELKKYKTYDSLPLILFSGDSVKFGLNFYLQNKTISTNNLFYTPQVEKKVTRVETEARSIAMRLNAGEGQYIEYQYTLEPNSYMVNFNIVMAGMDQIGTRNPHAIDLEWEIFAPQQEKGTKNENYYTTLYYKPYQEDVDFFNARSNKEIQREDITTQVEWVAFKDQFFSSVLIANNTFSNALLQYTNLPNSTKYLKNFRAEIGLPISRSMKEEIPMRFYFGPNKYSLLKKKYSDLQLHDLVTVGRSIIKWINQFVIIKLFDFLNKYFHNYGIIILLMTIIIKIALFPLTYKSFLSQAKMRVLKPQIDEINSKIPKEKAMERQQATMALYKKVGVSPMGGCLPMLLQMPILFAMFRFFPSSIELRQQSFLWATDLSTYDSIFEWQRNIPILSNIYGNHISLFTILMTVSTLLTMKFNDQSGMSNQQMPGMKNMMYIMPVMFMFILNNFSAGLTYYYFLANIITFGQNMLFKQFIDEDEILKKMNSKKAKPVKKSKFQARLEEMSKQRGYKPSKR